MSVLFLLYCPFQLLSWKTRDKYFCCGICLSVLLTTQNLLKVITFHDFLSFTPISVSAPLRHESPLKLLRSNDVSGEVLGSPKSTFIQFGKCECYLNSIDCLDFIECMPNQHDQVKLVREGIMIRQIIKANTTTFSGQPIDEVFLDNETISFSLQATTIAVWRRWLSKQELPVGMVSRTVSFANESMYSHCHRKKLKGWKCFLYNFQHEEMFNQVDEKEIMMESEHPQKLYKMLADFRDNITQSTALEYLLTFSHLSRIAFNLRPHILDNYKQHLRKIDHNQLSNQNILRMALHIRRDNLCQYENDITPMEADAQMGGEMRCYSNSVYMEALQRVMDLVNRHVVVYLATDYASSFLDEIKADPNLRSIYLNASWMYVDYPRDIFHYGSSNDHQVNITITNPSIEHKGILGESAFVDIWHLSHGHAFIGHLGSRFGKVSWIQAMGRNNAFVPFFSVDGHSFCCELDESCAKMDRFIVSMENCVSIFWPLSNYKEGVSNDNECPGYSYREKAAEVEIFHRIDNINYSEGDDPYDFAGSPTSKVVEIDECKCDIASVDCLHMIRCLKNDTLRLVHAGILFRNVLRETSHQDSPIDFFLVNAPIGMGAQYVTISVWKQWLTNNSIPTKMTSVQDMFVNESQYPICVEFGLHGRDCFLNEFLSNNNSDNGKYELQVKKAFSQYHDLERNSAISSITKLQANPFNVSTLEYLIAFSQISRITFDLRRHMLEIYDKYLETIEKATKHSANDVLRVAMHLRRGDSCGHRTTGYEMKASLLQSIAQPNTYRLCYDTKVYMDALQNVLDLQPERNVIVYLATDHVGEIMDEIKSRFLQLYQSVTWKYLKYPRQYFNYNNGSFDGSNYIESPENMYAANLGEAAATDLWHLSHGQVYIGHLGSRFGKFAWWQSIARYHSFVPYFSVDGHSVCCDIDEACGLVAKYIVSMENCLSIFWPTSPYYAFFDEDAYYSYGAHFRKAAASDELKFRALTKVNGEKSITFK